MTTLSLALIERSLWLLNVILCVVLSGRLFYLRVARTYRFFLSYLLFSTARSLAMWPLNAESAAYKNLWKLTEPILWILYVLVVLELCSLAFKEYRGIQALGRWTVYGSLTASLLFSAIALLPTWLSSRDPAFSTQRFLMVERGIDFCLVLLLLIVLASLVLFPIQLSKNVMIHCVLYSAFFLSGSMATLVANLTGERFFMIASSCLMAVSISCLVAWIRLLSRDGERKMVVIRAHMQPAEEERLVSQLATINATLLRASKKANTPIFSAERRL